MANELTVRARLTENEHFEVETGTGHIIEMDSDQAGGASPMEMLLVALAGCSGVTIVSILRKKRQMITDYKIQVRGVKAVEHPRVFTEIVVEHVLTGQHIRPQDVERAIELTEERYCGVSIMLAKATKLLHSYRILESDESEFPPE